MGFITDFIVSIFLNIALYLGAVIFTGLAIWLSIKSILLGGAINRLTVGVWIIAGVLWSIIGFKALFEYIKNDQMAQFVLLVAIIMAILFVPNNPKNQNKKNGNKK